MAQYNGGTSWTRHTNYFLAENRYDTTGIALATEAAPGSPGPGGTGRQGLTLISDRHVLMANHVSALWGTGGTYPNANANYPITVYFVNNNNTVFSYTINSAANVATIYSSNNDYTDISIGYLNTTIDPSLSFHKVIPSNFLDYLQISAGSNKTPVPYFPIFYMDGGDDTNPPNQIPNPYQKRTWCGNLENANIFANIVRPIAGKRFNNSQSIGGGDSGNIIFIPFNQEIIVLGTWYQTSGQTSTPGASVGISSFIAPHIDQINAAMTSLAGTSYSLTQADLSLYRKF